MKNNKKYLLTLMTIVLSSCGGSTISSNSTSSSKSTSLKEEYKIKDVERENYNLYSDDYEYHQPEFKEFPKYDENEWNTSLKFTLSADETYYIVSDNLAGDRLLNTDTLIIPAYYKGLPVEEIAQASDEIGAFSELTWLKTVYLPHTIKRIAYGTFSLTAIENLYIDCERLDDFDGRNWVFYPPLAESYKGMDVYFGPNVKRIPKRLFYPNVTEPKYVPKINNVYFDKNCQLEEIGAHAFHNVKYFTKLELPSTLKLIEEYAFYNTSFNELILPDSLEKIENDAFSFSKLTNIKLGNSLNYIGERAFAYSSLEGIDLSMTKLEIIEDEAFAYSSLQGIKFNNLIKEIRERAFINTQFTDLILPDSVLLIGNDCFSDLLKLKRLYLGKNLKVLGNKAFYNSLNLEYIEIASTSLDNLKTGNNIFTNAGKENGMKVYFLDGVVNIPSYLFFSTSNIDELCNIKVVSIPNTIKSIGQGAFYELDIERVNYRGSKEEYSKINIAEDNYSNNNLDCGGYKYA